MRSTVKLSHETMIVPRRYHHCHDARVTYWTNQSRFASNDQTKRGVKSFAPLGAEPLAQLVASEPTPLSRTVAFGSTEGPGKMALVEKATSESDLRQV